MNILSFAKLGITVISGLILSVGSVGNYTTSPITAEENLEAKGCAANFENKSLTPFYYDGPMPASKADVENLNNWKHGTNPELDCNNFNQVACVLNVSESYVDDSGPSLKIDPSINLTAIEISNYAFVSSIADNDGEFINRSL